MIAWLRRLRDAWRDPFDMDWDEDFPNSHPPIPHDMDCPDTEPTAPGALDSDPERN